MSDASPAPLSTRQPCTAAVITRIQLIEAPYLNEFVYWYVDVLGFLRVYAVNTEPWNEDAIMQHLDTPIKEKMTLIPLPVKQEQQNRVDIYMSNIAYKHIKQEEYILHVDSDELLLLPRTLNESCRIQDWSPLRYLLEKNRDCDKFIFQWLTISCNDMFCESMTELWRTRQNLTGKIQSDVTKTMAKMDRLKTIELHNMQCYPQNKVVNFRNADFYNFPILLHFNTRSKSHTILKILYQRMNNEKSKKSSSTDLREMLRHDTPPHISKYPPRILIHMHEVVYGERFNVLGDCISRAERVPSCPYTYPQEVQRQAFCKTMQDIVGIECEEAISKIDKYMDTHLINEFTHGKNDYYRGPLSAIKTKFRNFTI